MLAKLHQVRFLRLANQLRAYIGLLVVIPANEVSTIDQSASRPSVHLGQHKKTEYRVTTIPKVFNPIGPGGFEPNRDSNPIFKDGVRIHETESVLLSVATDVWHPALLGLRRMGDTKRIRHYTDRIMEVG